MALNLRLALHEDLAFVCHSTANLQGVEVCHGGVVNLLHYYRTATAPIPQGSMFFQTMPFIFDGSVMDIWLPLSMGCGIVVAAADDIKDPDIARRLIKLHSVAFLMITPSQFQVSSLQTRQHCKVWYQP
jgi:non-ribosomal peptide synthetase component F